MLALTQQLKTLSLPIELLIYDDASNHKKIITNLRALTTNDNVTLIENQINVGRHQARLNLAHQAQYDWLLFLDADVMLCGLDFIQKYISKIEAQEADVIFGGIRYAHNQPEQPYKLHWIYGKHREERLLQQRMENPVLSLVSANIAIKKSFFLIMSTMQSMPVYGRDELLLNTLIRKHHAKVCHINNPIEHLGLEKATVFLSKQLMAVKALSWQYINTQDIDKDRALVSFYIKLKAFRIHKLYARMLKPFLRLFKANLLGKFPNLRLLDAYKLYHFIIAVER